MDDAAAHDKTYSEEAIKAYAHTLASFYNELKGSGVPQDEAFVLTRDFHLASLPSRAVVVIDDSGPGNDEDDESSEP